MKIDNDKMVECLWDKNLRYQLLSTLFERPSRTVDALNDILPFFWRNFFSSICTLSIYLCEENIFTCSPDVVREFTKKNWEQLLERWLQIISLNEITASILQNAKSEMMEISLRNPE